MTNPGESVRYSTHEVGGFTVSVADGIAAMGAAGICVVGPAVDGKRPILWNEAIRVERSPGYPVMHSRHDGRLVCFGGPSHPVRDMALGRAAQLLEGRVQEAKSFAIGAAMEAAQRARCQRRAAAEG